ncbi:hypothetical protein MVEN_01745000 [Mycena venus]|uniref:Uncharacterized protein n=1 Tax=Mycena venus TaxID=2733690 RepID=A0A8H6XK85_9AGAR|nr:hypothetical protein MVEN_01745000 [Mycena venus]
MLVTLQRLDKLAALKSDLIVRGMTDDWHHIILHGKGFGRGTTIDDEYPIFVGEITAGCTASVFDRIQGGTGTHDGTPHSLVGVGAPVMQGFVNGRALLFFSFVFTEQVFERALPNWLVPVGDAPDPDMGMWIVELERQRGIPTVAIILIDAAACAAHLIPVYGTAALPEDFHFSDSLDTFNTYFVNYGWTTILM